MSRVPTRHSWGGGALERGHGAPLEPFAQFGDALGGVGTPDIAIIILVEAAELVVGQAASTGMWGVSTGADTKANTRGGGALQRGHGALLECLARLGDALRGVNALAKAVDQAAELVVGQTAKGRR